MTAADLEALYEDTDIAGWLGVSRDYVVKQCRDGRWPCVKVGRRYRFTRAHTVEILTIQTRQKRDTAAADAWGRSTRGSRR